MIKTRSTIVNAMLVVMGLLGLLVLVFPWYELNSTASVSGYTSSMSFGTQSGYIAASTSVFGYGLYILPLAAIALGFKISASIVPSRVKALALEFIGVGELLCMFLLQREMASYDTNLSGSGMYAHAGFDVFFGYKLAWGVYIATGVIGVLMLFVAPKPDAVANAEDLLAMDASAPVKETEPAIKAVEDVKWTCVNCGTANSANYGQCKKCGQYRSSQ